MKAEKAWVEAQGQSDWKTIKGGNCKYLHN